MATPDRATVFLDTSIQIARRVREPAMRRRISDRVNSYSLRVSSAVVLQEFKRRVLRDVAYLLAKLRATRSYMATLHYITQVLPAQQHRKMRICVSVLQNILPGPTDEELTERALLYCRTLLVYGESEFARELDSVLTSVDCYWAKIPVTEKKPYVRYELGGKDCQAAKGLCRVGESLKAKEARCRELSGFLEALPAERFTAELRRARDVLRRAIASNFQDCAIDNPCATVGDLLIALDSDSIPDLYTMNYRESQAYCDFLGQNLVRRPNNPDAADVEHLATAKPWPNP